MKTLLAFVFSFLFFTSAAYAQGRTDRELSDLIGQVKSVEAYHVSFTMKDGITEEAKREPWYSDTYNIDGKKTEDVFYGHPGSKCVYTYDTRGRCTGYEVYTVTSDNNRALYRKHIYTLDDKGNRIEHKIFDSDGNLADRFAFKYDTKGNEIEEVSFTFDGLIKEQRIYTYNVRGNLTGQIIVGADGSIKRKYDNRYDNEGKRIEGRRYKGDILRYKVIIRYDEKRRIIEEETMEYNAIPELREEYDADPGKVVFTYDDNKRTKDVATYSSDGSLKERVILTYDAKGNEVGRAEFKADGSPNYNEVKFHEDIDNQWSKLLGSLTGHTLVEFEYDSRGNWTRKTFLIQSGKGDEPQRYLAEERVITYY